MIALPTELCKIPPFTMLKVTQAEGFGTGNGHGKLQLSRDRWMEIRSTARPAPIFHELGWQRQKKPILATQMCKIPNKLWMPGGGLYQERDYSNLGFVSM